MSYQCQKPKRPEKSARLEEVQQERARDKHRLCTVGRLLHDVHARKIVGVPVVIFMPKAGDLFSYKNLDFEVVDMDRGRVDKLLVIKKEEDE
jgi:hypothetical protein